MLGIPPGYLRVLHPWVYHPGTESDTLGIPPGYGECYILGIPPGYGRMVHPGYTTRVWENGTPQGIPPWYERYTTRRVLSVLIREVHNEARPIPVDQERYTTRRVLSRLLSRKGTTRRVLSSCSHARLIFPFHCWLIFLPPCARVLSVAGFPAIPACFPFHCWAMFRFPVFNSRFTVGQVLIFWPDPHTMAA